MKAGKLQIPQSELEQGMPVKQLTQPMLAWLTQLDVLSTERYPLPGGSERRTFDVDSRLDVKTMTIGGQNIGPKNSDKLTYYEHVATLHHKTSGLTFVIFRMTMDALLASQKDPDRFPAWLMKHPVKKTELRCFIAVVKCPPTAGMTSIYEWLRPIDDIGEMLNCDVTWMYDAIAYFLMTKKVVSEDYFTRG